MIVVDTNVFDMDYIEKFISHEVSGRTSCFR
jgi:hypothetical protein